jgi:Fic family protein
MRGVGMMGYSLAELSKLPELESKAVLKAVASASRCLAELKGVSETIPNQGILINTLALQEAKDSSEIENIITTHDEMYKAELGVGLIVSSAAKEVQNYVKALRAGFQLVKKDHLLTCNGIKKIQAILEENDAGFRTQSGTQLKNEITGEVVYTPPQHIDDIIRLMTDLERYINDDSLSGVDPLIKMTIIHHQFESIHPFYDGNGRTGRIINILYLVLKGLLDIPTLYLSRYLIENKAEYYQLLQSVREEGSWEAWILYMLRAVEVTSQQTIMTIQKIKTLMMDYKKRIRAAFKFYSQDLLNNLFRYPYTKIEFLERELKVSRLTATRYLEGLAAAGFLEKQKIWRSNFYINRPLFSLLSQASKM